MATKTKKAMSDVQAAIVERAKAIRRKPAVKAACNAPGTYGDLMRALGIDPADDRRLRKMTAANVSATEVMAWVELGRPEIETYTECPASEIPAGVRFDVPRRNQGQIVTVSYGTFGRGEAGEGDPFMRVQNASLPWGHPEREVYYRKTWLGE